jgi:hypothetical protein
MTKRTPNRRTYTRRLRQVHVTTTRRERAPEVLARIITNAALGRAQREAEARADHHARLARDRALESPARQPLGEEAGDA